MSLGEQAIIAKILIEGNRSVIPPEVVDILNPIIETLRADTRNQIRMSVGGAKETVTLGIKTELINPRMGFGAISLGKHEQAVRFMGLSTVQDRQTELIIKVDPRFSFTVGRHDKLTKAKMCAAETAYNGSELDLECGKGPNTVFYDRNGIIIVNTPSVENFYGSDRELMSWLCAQGVTPRQLLLDFLENLKISQG